MSLRSLLESVEGPDHTVAVVADDAPGPVAGLLEEAFDGVPDIETAVDADLTATDLPPTLEDAVDPEAAVEEDLAVLLEDGQPVAASSMAALYDSLLAINSDLFVTGARRLGDTSLPDVLAGLEGTRLRLRGYPLAHKEKLLLILLSRYIEQLAWEHGTGTVRSAFQHLSRIDDEIGTRRVYEQLEETDLDVHVYGIDDGSVPDLEMTVHAGSSRTYRNSWFVVYNPPAGIETTDAGALVCLETEPRIWDGFFTFDPDCVDAIEDRIVTTL
ncbi:histidine kinase [Salinadaptatus halalkaliphilus]|uniref:Histidine kinase n=1 Tax=Salinadaptatus halalkaliphilus TaxID=2419781 RepID=A0A4S3TRG0_9EURY|nr:DICT sensory domain-containing protein [Salinadaptatus halalkaliphilus]THE65178.1 histidine kinase [Salinadaptatus halalkaliphilus]